LSRPLFINGFNHQNEILLKNPALENGVTLLIGSTSFKGAYKVSLIFLLASLHLNALYVHNRSKIAPEKDRTFKAASNESSLLPTVKDMDKTHNIPETKNINIENNHIHAFVICFI
jgi:hypothetical protein